MSSLKRLIQIILNSSRCYAINVSSPQTRYYLTYVYFSFQQGELQHLGNNKRGIIIIKYFL